MRMRHTHFRKFVQYLDIGRVYQSSYTELKRRTNEKHERKKKDQHIFTEPRNGHFLSDIYQKRKWTKKIRTEIKTKNISFQRHIISFKRYNKSFKRFKIEWKLKQENQNGN